MLHKIELSMGAFLVRSPLGCRHQDIVYYTYICAYEHLRTYHIVDSISVLLNIVLIAIRWEWIYAIPMRWIQAKDSPVGENARRSYALNGKSHVEYTDIDMIGRLSECSQNHYQLVNILCNPINSIEISFPSEIIQTFRLNMWWVHSRNVGDYGPRVKRGKMGFRSRTKRTIKSSESNKPNPFHPFIYGILMNRIAIKLCLSKRWYSNWIAFLNVWVFHVDVVAHQTNTHNIEHIWQAI